MLRWLTIIVLLFPVYAHAATKDQLDRLHSALGSPELMRILSDEGVMQSEELREEMFPGRGGLGWRAVVERVYDAERLEAIFRDAFDASLAETDIEPLLAFYTSDTGAEVARVEIDARRAIMSDEVEDAARKAFDEIRESGSDRLGLLQEFAEMNQLIDRNVAGALNANLAFFRGLGSGEGFVMTEDEILGQVLGREAQIREDTEGWVFGYMTFAYETLTDDQIRTYIDVSASPEGRELNRALFAGFDAVFQDVSFEMGATTSRFSVGEEL